MLWNLLLSWAVLLLTFGPLLAHPITDSAEMAYSGPVAVGEGGAAGAEDLSLTDLSDLLQTITGLGYSTQPSKELSRDGQTGLLPREVLREVLLEKPSQQSRPLGIRRQYRKRGNGADCFWKYCV
ncbi:urotensin 2, alpha [Chanos chanos]|uniref:Urotensin 2, alpha n=1 Tax=Chanos chanos TaxID=29144 RepID=A0A6J2UV90_CHACN|nr:prepro-urotensin II-alpha-like [Chanos chanos]